jgi:tmRNA-binding protein
MKYSDKNAKDRSILVGISKLSLQDRYRRVQELELALKNAQADLERKRALKSRTNRQERQLLADEDEIVEFRRQLTLERAEYLTQKEITPDYIEGAGR